MNISAHAILSQWESFYVIVGSSAGGLTGLWFVVIALAAESNIPRGAESTNAFGTPNVAHFAAVLVLSAILSVPWDRLKDAAHLVGLMGIVGVLYVAIVWRRMRQQSGYKPVLEDWIFHLALPLLDYVLLFVGAAGMSHGQEWALFLVAAVALAQLCVGIHNAWDTVTYIVANRREGGSP
jgi:hypothetical protein